MNRFDYNDEAISQEAEKVVNIINKCIELGLKWSVTKVDLNEKVDYVRPILFENYAIDCIKAIYLSAILLIHTRRK